VGDLDQDGTEDLDETFAFRNSGDTNLDVYGHVGDGLLNVGETWHYTASHTVTQAEMDAGGTITNTASVITAQGAEASGSAPVMVEQRVELEIDKVGAWVDGEDDDGFADVDELVNYTITVTNTGNVTLHGLDIMDPPLANLTRGTDIIGNNDLIFDVGEKWSFTGSHAITQAEIDAGTAHNDAIATALGPQDQPASDTDANDAALPQNPHFTLEKTGTFVDGGSEPNGYADPGEAVHYTFTITNDGNVTLSNLLLSDSLGLELIGPSGDDDFDGLFDVGEVWTFEGNYGITAADITAGSVHNEATASAEGPQTQPVSDDDSADTTLPPHLMTLDKSDLNGTVFVDADESGTASSGDLIEFVIKLENVSGVDLSNVMVDDPLLGGLLGPPDGDANNDGILSAGETWGWTINYFLTPADEDTLNNGGAVHNVATATAHDPSNNVVTSIGYWDQFLPGMGPELLV
jgi:large repetitive protein